MEFPLLSVLIPTHGRPTLLKRTLDSLARCALPAAYEELIVIENGSRDGAEAVVGGLPGRLNARYMHRERGNKSHALNEALYTIADGLVVFFDDDVRIEPSALTAYSDASRGVKGGVFFGSPIGADYETAPPDWLHPFLPGSAKGWGPADFEAADNPRFLGFNWAAFAADIIATGGFNPAFGPGSPHKAVGQETDMQERLLAAGIKQVFVPDAKVWHHVPAERCSPQWALRRQYQHGITHGFQQHHKDPALFGLPYWALRESARSLYMMTRDTLRGNECAVFASRANLYRYLGVMRGVRKRLQA